MTRVSTCARAQQPHTVTKTTDTRAPSQEYETGHLPFRLYVWVRTRTPVTSETTLQILVGDKPIHIDPGTREDTGNNEYRRD